MQVKILSSEYISQHSYFTARKEAYQLPSGKIVDPYFVLEIPPSATAMAITEDNQVVLVEQYRHPIGEKILELPGGFIEEGEDPSIAIGRELMEETGYEFSEIIYLGTTNANPGVMNNPTFLYLAKGGKKVSAQDLDPNEEIDIVLKSLDEVKSLLAESKIKQSMHALCLFYGFAHIEKS